MQQRKSFPFSVFLSFWMELCMPVCLPVFLLVCTCLTLTSPNHPGLVLVRREWEGVGPVHDWDCQLLSAPIFLSLTLSIIFFLHPSLPPTHPFFLCPSLSLSKRWDRGVASAVRPLLCVVWNTLSPLSHAKPNIWCSRAKVLSMFYTATFLLSLWSSSNS